MEGPNQRLLNGDRRMAKIGLLLCVLSLVIVHAISAEAQNTGRTVRKRTVAEDSTYSPLVSKAEAAIDRKDYAAAEAALKQVVASDPKNHRAWFDLGFVYNETGRTAEAIEAYRKSVEANPTVFESSLNLGVLLARAKDPEAEKYLRAATQLKPSARPQEAHARAWLTLGHVLERKDPKQALDAFQRAAELQPKEVEPHLTAGIVAERLGDMAVAEKEYRAAATLDPKSSEARAGLINVYMKAKRLPEAEAALREYLRSDPQNQNARTQLGRVLAAQGKTEEAVAELETALSRSGDPQARRELAQLYLDAKQYGKAAEQLKSLVAENPNEGELRRQLGTALLKQSHFAEAQQELLAALKLKPDMADAYGDLAVAASENKDYALAIRALDARAKLVPEIPATYFLRATAYDHLRDRERAAENYRKFLAASAGRFPDQEWQARHRLNAIDPKK